MQVFRSPGIARDEVKTSWRLVIEGSSELVHRVLLVKALDFSGWSHQCRERRQVSTSFGLFLNTADVALQTDNAQNSIAA